MIKCIIFDMGGVIVLSSSGIRKSPMLSAFRELAKSEGISSSDIFAYVERNDIRVMSRKMTEYQFFSGIKTKFKLKKAPKQLQNTLVSYYRKFSQIDYQVVKIIKTLKKIYALCVITDAYPMHVRERKEQGTYKIFDYVLTSLEAKQAKLEGKQGIYRMMLKKIKARPDECVMIDDKKKNLIAPKRMGMKTILFRNSVQLKRDLRKIDIIV